jgi:hypothetical protein
MRKVSRARDSTSPRESPPTTTTAQKWKFQKQTRSHPGNLIEGKTLNSVFSSGCWLKSHTKDWNQAVSGPPQLVKIVLIVGGVQATPCPVHKGPATIWLVLVWYHVILILAPGTGIGLNRDWFWADIWQVYVWYTDWYKTSMRLVLPRVPTNWYWY